VPLKIPPVGPGTLNFLESVEAAHADLAFNSRVSELLNITRAPTRMDSQAKYGCLARGDGGVYLRMPTGTGYQEKIWVSWVLVLVRCILNCVLACRITLLDACSSRNVGVSLQIHGANVSTLDLGGRWARIMVLLLQERTSMGVSWLLFSRPGQRWTECNPVDPNLNMGFCYIVDDSMCIASDHGIQSGSAFCFPTRPHIAQHPSSLSGTATANSLHFQKLRVDTVRTELRPYHGFVVHRCWSGLWSLLTTCTPGSMSFPSSW